jgi:large subunit ribosomal protein L30
MAKVKITQKSSRIGSTKRQKATLDALGLKKINSTVEHEYTSQIKGMVTKVSHLVKVEEL